MIKKHLKKKSVKDLFAISISTLSNQIVGLFRGFFVAKFLGPADFGILKAVQLIIMLDKFGSLGFRTVATREVSHFKGTGDLDNANKTRNVAYSGELLLATLLFLIGICSSLFFDSIMLVTAVLLASGQLFTNKILGIFNTEAIIEKKVVLYSKILFWSGLLSSLVIIATVPFLKIYTVLGIPLLATIISCCIYYSKIGAKLEFDVSKKELLRLIRIGIPITMSVLAYGAYRYSERILVGSLLGIQALGIFSLAMMPMAHMSNLLRLAIKVRGVNIYQLLGQKKFYDVHKMVVKETAILFVMALILVPILWIAVDLLISSLMDSYLDSIAVCKVFLLVLPFRMLSCYTNVVVISSVVNKQIFMGPLHLASTVIFALSVLTLKYYESISVFNIAIADVICQSLLQLSILVLYKKYFMNAYLTDNK